MDGSIPNSIDFTCVSEDRLSETSKQTVETSKQRFLSHSHDISSIEQSQLRARLHGKSKLIEPSLHRALLSFGRRRKRMKSYMLALKALPRNDSPFLFCSHFVFQRKSITWECMRSRGWRRRRIILYRGDINVRERFCRQLLVFLPYSALVIHLPSLLKKRLTVPSLNPLRLNAF